MVRKLSKIGRSTLSVLLCLAMLLTTFCFFDIGSVISEALINKSSHALTEAGTSSDTFSQYTIMAPELVYIKAGGKDSQYFLNASSSGTVNEPTSGTSTLSFSCATARSITISVALLDANLSATSANRPTNIAFSDGTYMSSDRSLSASSSSITKTIKSITMANAEQGKEYILRWTIVYTTASGSYTTYAYTGIKFPLLSQAGMTTRQYYYGTSGGLAGNPAESAAYSFITGVDAVKGGNIGSKWVSTGSSLTAPLINFNSSLYPNSLDAPINSTYFDPNGSGVLLAFAKRDSNNVYFAQGSRIYNTQWDSSSNYNPMSMIQHANYFGGKPSTDGDEYGYAAADITIDISRYTNFNQVPNLSAGFVEFDSDAGEDDNYLNAIRNCSYTTSDAADYFRNNRTTDISPGKQNTSATIYCENIDRSDEKNDRSWVRGLYKLTGNISEAKANLTKSTSSGTSLRIATFTNNVYSTYIRFEHSLRFNPWIGYKEYCSNVSAVKLNATLANKSTARTYYYKYLNSGVNTSASNWSTINSYVQSYVKTLCVSSAAAGSYTDPTSAISTAQTDLKTNKMKTTTPLSAPVYFYVPETIYLTPKVNSWISSTSAGFAYFIQNNVDTSDTSKAPTVTKGARTLDGTGYVYFSYDNIDGAVTLTTRNLKASTITNDSPTTLSGGSISSLSLSAVGKYQRATITTASTSPTLTKDETGYYIEWTASFKDKADGHYKKAVAYTYVYKPYVIPTAAGLQIRCKDGNEHDNGQLTWMSGFHSIYAEAKAPSVGSNQTAMYPRYSTVDKAYAFMPFMSYSTGSISGDLIFKVSDMGTSGNQNVVNTYNGVSKPDYRKQSTTMKLAFASATNSSSYFKYKDYANNWPWDWMSDTKNASATVSSTTTVDMKTGSFFYWRSGDDLTAQNADGGIGQIYIDTSRYTNLNQIPNLGVGMQMTDNKDDSTSDNGAWMIGDATGLTLSSYTDSRGNGGKMREEWTNVNYYIAGMGNPDNRNSTYDRQELKYAGNWNRTLLNGETSTYQIKTAQMNNQGNDWVTSMVVLQLRATQLDKSDLRAAVRTAQMNLANFGVYDSNLNSRYYKNEGDYANFVSNYKTACAVLDKVDGYSGYTTQSQINALKTALLANIAALVKEGNTALKRDCTANEYNLGLEKLSNGQYKIVEIDGGKQYSMKYDARDNVYFTPDSYEGYTFAGKYELTNISITPSSLYEKTIASLPTFLSASNLNSSMLSTSGSTVTISSTGIKTTTVPKFDGNNTTYEWVAAVNDSSLTMVNFYYVNSSNVYFDPNDGSSKVNLLTQPTTYQSGNDYFAPTFSSSPGNGVTATFDQTTSVLTVNGTPTTGSEYFRFPIAGKLKAGSNYTYRAVWVGGSKTLNGTTLTLTFDICDKAGERVYKSSGQTYSDRFVFDQTANQEDQSRTVSPDANQAANAAYVQVFTYSPDYSVKPTYNNYQIKIELVESGSPNATYSPNAKQAYYGHNLGTMPVPTRTNYRFLGWFTAPDGGDRVTASTVMGSKDMTVYAHWALTEKTVLLDNEFDFDDFTAKASTAASTLNGFANSFVARSRAIQSDSYKLSNQTKPFTSSVSKDDVGDTSLNIKYDRSTASGSSDGNVFDTFKSSTFTASTAGDYTLTYEYRINDYYSQVAEATGDEGYDSVVLGFATNSGYWVSGGAGTMYTENKKTSDGYETVELKRSFSANDQFFFSLIFYYCNSDSDSGITSNRFRADVDVKNIVIKDPNGNIVLSSNSMATTNGSSSFDPEERTITIKPAGTDCYTSTYNNGNMYIGQLAPGKYTFMMDYTATTNACITPFVFLYSSAALGSATNKAAYISVPAGSGTVAYQFDVTSGSTYYQLRFSINSYGSTTTVPGAVTLGNISLQRTEIYSDNAYVTDSSTYLGWLNGVSGTQGYVTNLTSRNENITSHYQDLDHGSKYNGIHVPTREGFTFLGWWDAPTGGNQITDANGNAVGSQTITKTTKLYSHWTPKTFNLKYNAYKPNDSKGVATAGSVGNLPTPNPQTLKFGVASTVSATVPTLTGYTFNGWSKTSGGSKWVDKGASLSASTVSQMYKDCSGGTYNIYTVWNPNKFTVAFNANGGTGTMANQQFTYDVYQNLTANAFTRTGYTYQNWNTKADGSGTTYKDKEEVKNLATSGTVTLYAQWNVNYYNVTYDYATNGGQSATKTSASVAYGSAVDLTPTATKSGWSFVGWNTNKDATTGLSSLTMPANNVTLYAIYKKTLTANFYSGINKAKNNPQSVTIWNRATSGTVKSPTTYEAVWTFVGWTASETATASTSYIGTGVTVTINASNSTVNYYALYKELHTLKYDANGGTGAPASTTSYGYYNSCGVQRNGTHTISTTAPTRTGYTFGGW